MHGQMIDTAKWGKKRPWSQVEVQWHFSLVIRVVFRLIYSAMVCNAQLQVSIFARPSRKLSQPEVTSIVYIWPTYRLTWFYPSVKALIGQKKICGFPVSRPYLAFGRRNPDPKLFYWIMLVNFNFPQTFSSKWKLRGKSLWKIEIWGNIREIYLWIWKHWLNKMASGC
jgi:hypothetical protein